MLSGRAPGQPARAPNRASMRSARVQRDFVTVTDFSRATRASAHYRRTPGPMSWDAIHLATAHAHRHILAAFCVYDRGLLEAAKSQGLPTMSPCNGAVDR